MPQQKDCASCTRRVCGELAPSLTVRDLLCFCFDLSVSNSHGAGWGAQWSLSHAVGGVAVTNSHPSGMRGVDLEPRHATPRAEAKDIVAVLRPRIERELCEVGGALRRKVEAEYQSEIVEKYRELKRRHQVQRQQLDQALRELDDAQPPRKRARV
jgi:hypothetical protein